MECGKLHSRSPKRIFIASLMSASHNQSQFFPADVQSRESVIVWDKSGDLQYGSVSQFSPGVLLSGDCIVRAVFCPQHFGATGFGADFVTDAFHRGFSCQRVMCSAEAFPGAVHQHFLQTASQLIAASGKPRKYLGFLTARVGAVRSISSSFDDPFNRSHRARAYDTALEQNIGHCDVFLNDSALASGQSVKLIKNEIRSRLLAVFSDGQFYKSPALSDSDEDLIHLRSMLA